MTATVGEGVSLRGIYDEEYSYTWNITGTCTAADVSKAVVQDTTAANSVKLATAGAAVIGSLMSYENRIQEGIVVGAVCRKGVFVWPYTGADPTLGQGVTGGATPGYVAAVAAFPGCIVVQVDTVGKLVTVVFD
jgi:hypothetical protein